MQWPASCGMIACAPELVDSSWSLAPPETRPVEDLFPSNLQLDLEICVNRRVLSSCVEKSMGTKTSFLNNTLQECLVIDLISGHPPAFT